MMNKFRSGLMKKVSTIITRENKQKEMEGRLAEKENNTGAVKEFEWNNNANKVNVRKGYERKTASA